MVEVAPLVAPARAQLVVRALDLDLTVGEAARRLVNRDRVTAWSGAWSHGALLTCDPVRVVRGDVDDVLRALADQPAVTPDPGRPGAVGGGWFGYLAFPATTRRDGGRLSSVGWYRDVLRHDGVRWWYEALVDEDAGSGDVGIGDFDVAAAEGRCEGLVAELAVPAAGDRARLTVVGEPDRASYLEAVERCRQAIRRGEIYQANIATQLDLRLTGSVHDAWAQLVEEHDPARAGLVADDVLGAVSASPELFLRRGGRVVCTEPIKGTRPRRGGDGDAQERARLGASEKDAAENVMIVDLMRNDLARVCVPGSVTVPRLLDVQAHPGVWHLVSTVSGRLADGCDDSGLLAATFPPGSVTGAPKHRAVQVIEELEAGARGLFTGALGYSGPLAGLELAVTIRTVEVDAGGAARLGVGAGITVDSTPALEWAECLDKAAPVLRTLGAGPVGRPGAPADLPPGLFETLLVRDGEPVRFAEHLARLRRSYWECYGHPLTADVAAAVTAALRPGPGHQRVRVEATAAAPDRVRAIARDCPAPVAVAAQPGLVLRLHRGAGPGSGYKSVERSALEAIEAGLGVGECAVLVGPGERVRETTRSNVFVVIGGVVHTPLLDGTVLPGTARQAVLDRMDAAGLPYVIGELGVADLARADGAFVTNAVRGVRWVRAIEGTVSWASPHPLIVALA